MKQVIVGACAVTLAAARGIEDSVLFADLTWNCDGSAPPCPKCASMCFCVSHQICILS